MTLSCVLKVAAVAYAEVKVKEAVLLKTLR